MTTNRFLTIVSGLTQLVTAISSSAGAGDANKIIATGGDGKLDSSLLPTGIGAETETIQASETLAAGDWVNLFDSTGARVRKADGSNGREAHGFVLAGVTSGQDATVYRAGINTQVTSPAPGATYWLSTASPGTGTTTAPTLTTGHTIQVLGVGGPSGVSFNYNPGALVA
jgi:hypothetical protein